MEPSVSSPEMMPVRFVRVEPERTLKRILPSGVAEPMRVKDSASLPTGPVPVPQK